VYETALQDVPKLRRESLELLRESEDVVKDGPCLHPISLRPGDGKFVTVDWRKEPDDPAQDPQPPEPNKLRPAVVVQDTAEPDLRGQDTDQRRHLAPTGRHSTS
jgi:hypothetical protein